MQTEQTTWTEVHMKLEKLRETYWLTITNKLQSSAIKINRSEAQRIAKELKTVIYDYNQLNLPL